MPEVSRNSMTEKFRRENPTPKINKYYKTVSDRFMKAKLVSIVILVIFFAFMLVRYSDSITYSNLMYLMRDLDTDPKSSELVFDKVTFDEQKNMNFAVYKGELSVAGNRSLKTYNEYGAETRSYQPGYNDPFLVSSDKYLMAYNIGTPSYSVYTSIAKIHSGEASGNIEYADMNDRGDFLLVCKSKDTKYVICTYDSSFRPIAEYYKTRYVTSACIGNKGQVIIVSFASEDGVHNSQIELYYDNSDKPDNSTTISGAFPLKCGIWNDGSYYLICTDRILFFDAKGNLVNTYTSVYEFTSYAEAEDRIAVSYDNDSIGGSSDVLLFDNEGNLMYNNTVDGSISSISIIDNVLYSASAKKVYRSDTDSGEVISTEVEYSISNLLPYGNTCVACHKNGIDGLVFEDDVVVSSDETTEISDN